MNFIIAEKYGLKYMIVEKMWPNECYTLTISTYYCTFDEWRPSFKDLNGMNVRLISDKEALELLKGHTNDSAIGWKITKFIDNYEELPF